MQITTAQPEDIRIAFDQLSATGSTPQVQLPLPVNNHTLNYAIINGTPTVTIKLIGQTAAGYQTVIASATGVTVNGTMSGTGIFTGIVVDVQITGTGAVLMTYAGRMFAANPVQAAFNTNTATANTTLTAANITGGVAIVDLALTGTLGGAANAQLPTVAAMLAAMSPPPVVGSSFSLRIINESSGAFAWTVTTNTGWTLTGTMTIAQNTWREFVVTVTSVTAATATLQSVATGTFS